MTVARKAALSAVPDPGSRVQDIIRLETERERLDGDVGKLSAELNAARTRASDAGWELAELYAAELADGKSKAALGREVHKSPQHVTYMSRCHEAKLKFGSDSPSFNEVYNSPEVRGPAAKKSDETATAPKSRGKSWQPPVPDDVGDDDDEEDDEDKAERVEAEVREQADQRGNCRVDTWRWHLGLVRTVSRALAEENEKLAEHLQNGAQWLDSVVGKGQMPEKEEVRVEVIKARREHIWLLEQRRRLNAQEIKQGQREIAFLEGDQHG